MIDVATIVLLSLGFYYLVERDNPYLAIERFRERDDRSHLERCFDLDCESTR